MKIDLQRFLNDTRFDVDDLHVFDISKPVRQRHTGRIALALSLNVEICRSLQAVPRAGHLRETHRRHKQCGREHDPLTKNTAHRTPPISCVVRARVYHRIAASEPAQRTTSAAAGDAMCASMCRAAD